MDIEKMSAELERSGKAEELRKLAEGFALVAERT